MADTQKSLNAEILQSLKSDEALMLRIAKVLNRKFRSVERWIRDEEEGKSSMLTSEAAVKVISESIGLTEDEILTKSKVEA